MKAETGPGAAVLDFSGTLSLGAVHFGRPQSLEQALQDSGLADLGLCPASFWSEVINPTWREGSTTPLGYRRLLCDRVRRFSAARGENPALETVCAAVGRFTAVYLRRSTIEPEWAPVLRRLASRKVIVVATDHYAEATAHIIQQLAGLGLDAAPARQARPGQVLVANSADLGKHKEKPAFWNEQPADSYAAAKKVAARRAVTIKAIETAWHTPVNVFPFLLHCEKDYPALVSAAGRFMARVS